MPRVRSDGEDLVGVRLGLDLLGGEDVGDGAVGTDKECGAQGAHVFAPVHGLLAPYAHGLLKAVVGVGNEGEGQVVGGDEFLMRGGRIAADAYDAVAFGGEGVDVVAQRASLGGASGGVVLGVEIEYEIVAGEVGQFYFLAVLVGAQQFGRFVSYVHNFADKG